MAQENRYPSPEPGNPTHPYHNSQQQISEGVSQHIQHAPTALMHEGTSDSSGIPQGFQYVAQYGAPQPSTPQQLARQGLEVDDNPNSDPSARKKSKVSRACDECRRKKVRCDAETDQDGAQCTNCKRTNTFCQFSRQPQKRGPSKGYIKELAERVSRLEYPGAPGTETSYATNHGLPTTSSQTYPTTTDQNAQQNQRKRTHSVAELPPNYMHAHDQLQEYTRLSNYDAGSSISSQPILQAPIYPSPAQNGGGIPGLHSATLDGYYKHIHNALPLLPESHSQLQADIERNPPNLQQPFKLALSLAVSAATTSVHNADVEAAERLCLTTYRESATFSESLLHLQTLIFLTIVHELRGPATSRVGTWLGSAVSIANSLHLQKSTFSRDTTSNDPSNLSRRAWLSLIILDRWHAASVCAATLIHDEDVNIESTDHTVLGSSSYHLLRISIALGHLSNVFLHHSQDLVERRPSGRSLVQLMRGEVARILESIEAFLPQLLLVRLAYLHIKILSDKATEGVYSTEKSAIDAAIQIVDILDPKITLPNFSPFQHHFAGLAAVALTLIIETDPQAVIDPLSNLRQYCDSGQLPPVWSSSISRYITTKLEAHAAEAGGVSGPGANNQDGLRHLANAAVGTEKTSKDGKPGWDSIMKRGYLKPYW